MRRMPIGIAVTAFALVCGASVAQLLGAGPFRQHPGVVSVLDDFGAGFRRS